MMADQKNILEKMDEEILSDEENVEEEDEISREEKEKEKRDKADQLWIAVQSGNTKYLITRVASILNHFPDTRKSDVALMIKYWEVFEGHRGKFVSLKKLFKLERLTSISRTRAKIQHEYGLFQSDEKTRRYRQNLEEIQKEYQIATKPEMESIFIYADESGKNDDFAIVGSVWVLAGEGSLNRQLSEWIQERKKNDELCPDEFHFNKIKTNGNNLQVYKDFFNFVVANGHMIGFKAIAVNKTKITKPIDEVITTLFYQLVRLGVKHEIKTGRITFPKQIAYIKDKEDGESALRLTQISQSLLDNFKLHYEGDLQLNSFTSIDSKFSRLIQVSDLFTAAINRRINHQRINPDSSNAKDIFTEHIYELLNIQHLSYNAEQLSDEHDQSIPDSSIVYIFD